LRDAPQGFNSEKHTFVSIEDIAEFLIDRYGKMPGMRRKVLNSDTVIGFTHSFWNSDISHNSKHWYQTDWIIVREVEYRYPQDLLKKIRKSMR